MKYDWLRTKYQICKGVSSACYSKKTFYSVPILYGKFPRTNKLINITEGSFKNFNEFENDIEEGSHQNICLQKNNLLKTYKYVWSSN